MVTFGTTTGAGPLATLTRTVDPLTAGLPGPGAVAVTWPAVPPGTVCTSGVKPASLSAWTASPCDLPSRLGTSTIGLPVETQIVTSLPLATSLPSAGSCLKTSPAAVVSFVAVFTFGTRPIWAICATASLRCSLT